MKTTSIILNFILIAVVLYLGFHNRSTAQPAQQPSCNRICADYSRDNFKGINVHLAKLLADNYAKDEGKKFIGNGRAMTTTEDARNAWFPLETIKRYIWMIENAACKKNCNAHMRLGIRIYYGKYPDAATMQQTVGLTDVRPEYEKHHTVFLVPTYSDGGKHLDFDPQRWGTNDCLPTTLSQYMASIWKLEAPADGPILVAGDAQNHGDMSPPPSGTGQFATE